MNPWYIALGIVLFAVILCTVTGWLERGHRA